MTPDERRLKAEELAHQYPFTADKIYTLLERLKDDPQRTSMILEVARVGGWTDPVRVYERVIDL